MNKTLYLLILLLASCANERRYSAVLGESELQNISIDEKNYYKSFNVDSIFYDIFYVFPQTNDLNRIGSYDKIVVVDSLIYIMDKKFSHSILCIDFSGKTKFKLSKLGSGPEEYRELRDFIIDEELKTLEILDFGGRRIKKYDYLTGDYLEEIRFSSLDVNYGAFEKFGGKYIVSHDSSCGLNNQCNDLSILDSNFNIIQTFIPIDKYLNVSNYKGNNNLFKNMDEIYFKQVYNDTIYNVDLETGIVKYKFYIDFGDKKMPSKTRFSSDISDIGELSRLAIDQNFSWGIHSFFHAGNYLYFYNEGKILSSIVYSLKNRKGYRFDNTFSKDGNLFLTGKVIGAYNEYFISFQNAENISNYAKGFFGKDSVALRIKYEDMYNLMKNVETGDNGILTFFKINIK